MTTYAFTGPLGPKTANLDQKGVGALGPLLLTPDWTTASTNQQPGADPGGPTGVGTAFRSALGPVARVGSGARYLQSRWNDFVAAKQPGAEPGGPTGTTGLTATFIRTPLGPFMRRESGFLISRGHYEDRYVAPSAHSQNGVRFASSHFPSGILHAKAVRSPARFHYTPPDTAGTPVNKFRKLSREIPNPPAILLGGNHIRRGGVSEDIVYILHSNRQRMAPGQDPHPSQLLGGTLRRDGFAQDIIEIRALIPKELSQFLPAQYPPRGHMIGHVVRRGGVSEDLVHVINRQRVAPGQPPHPSQLLGGVVRREGVSEDLTYIQRRTRQRKAPGQRPHPKQLLGKVTRRDGIDQDQVHVIPGTKSRFLHSKPPHRSWIVGRTRRRDGSSPPWTEYASTYQQGYRVADDTLDRYEMFVGVDQPADLQAAPVTTSATLPFQWTPPLPTSGTSTLHIVVRRRNKYGLGSFNVYETLVVVNSAGVEELGPVSAPFNVQIYDATTDTHKVRVIAKYLMLDASPADTWEIYIGVGVDPVVGVDTPAFEGLMASVGDESAVNETLGSYTPGDVLHVVVAAKRSSDGERGVSDVVLWTVSGGLDLSDGNLFGGTSYEQE